MSGHSHFINGQWIEGAGPALLSTDPATGQTTWEGHAATAAEIDQAVIAARTAFEQWGVAPLDERIKHLEAFAAQLRTHRPKMVECISRETGKPRWESATEVDAMIGKVAIAIDAYKERCRPAAKELPGALAATRYKPHGVVAVFGPFNFPGHLPNGHIIPALLAGNCIVYKPSELAPTVGQKMLELWETAGLPAGVMNMVQGGRDAGAALAAHPGIDGLFFTGSAAAGRALSRALADHPEKILALEMGGNNPLVVWHISDVDAAAYLTIQSAFLTAGQRCSCARRLIVPQEAEGDRLVNRVLSMMRKIQVGPSTQEPEPFMGPVISDQAAEQLLAAHADLGRRGAVVLSEMSPVEGCRLAMLRPGLIDVTTVAERPDVELFGPLVQLIRVPDFEAALREANNTAYGLSAGLFSDEKALYEEFYRRIRAGVVYWNRQTTGASSNLPFGGVGISGNHRPSAYFAADYCSYPVASMECEKLTMPQQLTPGLSP